MSLTNTGRYVRMGILKAVMQNASTMSASIEFCLRTNLMPSLRLVNIDSVVLSGRKRVVISKSETMGARKESAFNPKHHFSPNFAKAIPASAGPIVTARLNWIEFSAMAFGMSSLSTNVGISAWYAGPPKAWAKPETTDRHRMGQTWVNPFATRIVSTVALPICTYWETSEERRVG